MENLPKFSKIKDVCNDCLLINNCSIRCEKVFNACQRIMIDNGCIRCHKEIIPAKVTGIGDGPIVTCVEVKCVSCKLYVRFTICKSHIGISTGYDYIALNPLQEIYF